ncbi:MAG: hypothetical protein V1750_01700 [Acidobacteriota bacterium]
MSLVLALVVLAAQVDPGTPIVAVCIERHDVFDVEDPATSAWPYRTANALHMLSREAFIRSLLLFREGDTLDPARLAESERLLRATGFLSPVNITARPVEGGAEVVVETRDQWTTELSLNYGQLGARQKTGLSLSEQDFLGWGKKVDLVWRSDEERNSVSVAYFDPLLLGSRWRLTAMYRDTSDGAAEEFRVVYPFFALDTAFAGGIEWQRERLKDYLWSGGEKIIHGDSDRLTFRLWGGMRLPGGRAHTDRITAGVFAEHARFSHWYWQNGDPYLPPNDRELVGLEIGWEREQDRWVVLGGFRGWQRQEDLPLGPNWKARVGLAVPGLGADRRAALFNAELTAGALRGRQYTWLLAGVSGRAEHREVANLVAHIETGTARTGASGWRARFAVDLGGHLDRDRQLTLGADTGLRGWQPDTFDGSSRAVANLEWRRRLTGEVLHLGIIGMTLFADGGRTWRARVGQGTRRVHGDIGAGLAIEITRAAILRIVRVEVALPDDGGGPLVLLTGASLF